MYGCHNKPRQTPQSSYLAQDGYALGITTREPSLKWVGHAMSTECQYSKNTVDAKCDGCMNKGQYVASN